MAKTFEQSSKNLIEEAFPKCMEEIKESLSKGEKRGEIDISDFERKISDVIMMNPIDDVLGGWSALRDATSLLIYKLHQWLDEMGYEWETVKIDHCLNDTPVKAAIKWSVKS